MIVNARDNRYLTPLHLAARHGHVTVVATLIAAGANLNAKSNTGHAPLHDVAANFGNVAVGVAHVTVVAALIAAGADVNTMDNFDSTPVHSAANAGYVTIVAALIAAGADVNTSNRGGRTPLHDVVRIGLSRYSRLAYVAMVSMLIAAKADVNAENDDGETPLRYGYAYGNINKITPVIPLLIAAGGRWGDPCPRGTVANPAWRGPLQPTCVAAADCAAPTVRNAGENRCECPSGYSGDGAICNADVTVSFSSPANGTLSAASGDGAIQNGDTVAHGATVTFTAEPASGYEVSIWLDDCAGAVGVSCEAVATADVSVGVEFCRRPRGNMREFDSGAVLRCNDGGMRCVCDLRLAGGSEHGDKSVLLPVRLFRRRRGLQRGCDRFVSPPANGALLAAQRGRRHSERRDGGSRSDRHFHRGAGKRL